MTDNVPLWSPPTHRSASQTRRPFDGSRSMEVTHSGGQSRTAWDTRSTRTKSAISALGIPACAYHLAEFLRDRDGDIEVGHDSTSALRAKARTAAARASIRGRQA